MSKLRLRKEEFLSNAPSSVGFVRLNHDSPECKGSSKSLKIERKEDGTVNAICYRCSASGYHRPSGAKYKEAQGSNSLGYNGNSTSGKPQHYGSRRVSVPASATSRIAEWNIRGREWIRKYALTQQELDDNGIRFDTNSNWMYIPVRNGSSVIGYIRRCFSTSYNGPKYITNLSGEPRHICFSTGHPNTGGLCIVEDIISAIKCSRVVDSLALVGTYLSPATINAIKCKYNSFIVFLDDDNRQVRMRQLRIARQLELYGNVRIIKGIGRDPKQLSTSELTSLLTD